MHLQVISDYSEQTLSARIAALRRSGWRVHQAGVYLPQRGRWMAVMARVQDRD